MQFRPFFWPTFFALPALLVLLWLGTWQVQRLEWKNQLIEDFESRATAAPIDLPRGPVGPDMEFRRLSLTGMFDHKQEVFMTGRTYEGNAGFHIVTPFTLTDGRIVLVNRGWVSESYREQDKRPFTLVEGEVTLPAILRFPGKKGYFVPENEPDNGFWFTLVPSQIVRHLGLEGRAETEIYAATVRTSDTIELPIAARTETNLRNSHLGYAITWYGIACALIGVYLAFHYQAGRLRFTRGDGAQE
ncbi:MAG: SURF1 family protein [Candidatus Puniceispirillaceae bacterium]